MVTFHHRIKTHGHWQVQQPFPGVYLWRDPHGATYLSTPPAPAGCRSAKAQPDPALRHALRA